MVAQGMGVNELSASSNEVSFLSKPEGMYAILMFVIIFAFIYGIIYTLGKATHMMSQRVEDNN